MTTRGKKNERGATAVEYGLLVAAVLVIALTVFGMNGAVKAAFTAANCTDSLGHSSPQCP